MKLSLSLIGPKVLEARLRGYKYLLIGQIVVMVIFLFLSELMRTYPFPNWENVLLALTGFVMVIMNILSYYLIKELTANKKIQYFILGLLWMSVVLGMASGIFNSQNYPAIYTVLFLISISASLISFLFLISYMVTDIFREKHEISYRLWGSASIYVLYGAVFGLLFILLEILLPAEFNVFNPNDQFYFVHCYNLSFYTLSGIDSPYEEFSLLVKNVTVIESVLANLFIVLVVGRLLAK